MGTHLDLAGKVAVVTGVTRRAGIGAAIARDLVGAGAAVFTTHFREYDKRQTWGVAPDEPESILVALGAQGAGIELDLSNPSAAVDLFNQANSRFGPVDILVNNAAHWESGGINQASAEELDRHYAVNLRAPVLLCSEFVRRRPSVGDRIINVTSGQGRGPMPGALAYAVTKAGLDALTLSLAADLRTSGVTVNAIDPGPIDTGWMTADLRTSLAAASPSGSLARPEDRALLEGETPMIPRRWLMLAALAFATLSGTATGQPLVSTEGSHRQFEHPMKRGRVTVSGSLGDDQPKGTLASVKRQAGSKAAKP